ncbi:hypothetical protein [Stieleria mannarensis]|uniref:hypothetical protein n=1 Tax=Stieleria mannarensis TaxID=2755585 RepID=UPI0015FF050F|nr:hypothetical protein [Rhodopirellula sp. JC639]
MFAFAQNTNLLAVLLLPYSIPVDVVIVFLCSLLLVFAAAVIGARATADPFRWRRVAGATLGVMMGVVLSPLALGVSCLLVNLTARFTNDALPPTNMGFAITSTLFILMTSSVAYFVSKIGWPARVAHGMEMELLTQNLGEIEKIVSGKLRNLGCEVSRHFDVGAAQTAGILSQDQATRMEHLFQMQTQLQQARSVLHSDVELWAGQSRELLDELTRQLSSNRESTLAVDEVDRKSRENGNPYAPPAS